MEGQSCSTKQGKQINCGWDKKVWQQEVDFKEQCELEQRLLAYKAFNIKRHFLPETNFHLQNAEATVLSLNVRLQRFPSNISQTR